MNAEAISFIKQQFDFEHEDQPDNISDYSARIDYMWKRGEEMGISKEIKEALTYLVTQEDPTIALNSYFLPGKHDIKEILQMALDREMILHSQSFG